MSSKKKMPGPITILMIVIVLAAILTWFMPAGQYSKLTVKGNAFEMSSDAGAAALPLTQKTLDSLGINIALAKFTGGDIQKPVSVPGTFKPVPQNGQGPLKVLQAPIKGIVESIEIILFILIIGGFMFVFNETGAMVRGVTALSYSMQGREQWLIIILTVMFSFFGGSFGMAEEAFVFYPILVPVFLAAGFDLLVPLAVIFGGTTIGALSGFSNPFATIIASNAAGVNWMDGLEQRLIVWAIVTAGLVWYILRYGAKVRKDPSASIVSRIDGDAASPYELHLSDGPAPALGLRTKLLLAIYIMTFLAMIAGVVFLGWWTLEMSALFLASAILVAVITGMNEKVFVGEFIRGAESLLSVAFIVGIARGVTVILSEGHIADSILFSTAGLVEGISPGLFILLLLLFYFVFSLFIQSSSGMAVLTMPIIGALALMVNLPGREIVNSYMYGMSLMAFIAPTGLILPSLAMVNVSLKAWFKFITPFLIATTVFCIIALLIGIHL